MNIFTTTFACEITPIDREVAAKYVALASVDDLRKHIPDVDTDKNYDVLPVAFQGFNVNLFNKNDDGMDSQGAIDCYKTFIGKFLDLEHDRSKIVGYITSATLTDKDNKELSEDEAKEMKEPFNVVFGGVLWRLVDKKFAEKAEANQDPESPYFGKIFASFELGFDDCEVVGTKNSDRKLNGGAVLDKSKYIHHLRCNKGSGSADGYKLFRLVKGNLLGLGAALTLNPAAFVEPIVADIETDEEDEESNETESKTKEVYDWEDVRNMSFHEILKELNKKSVTQAKTNSNKNMPKITKLEDLTDDVVKEIGASKIQDFIHEKLQEAADTWDVTIKSKEQEALAAKQAHEALVSEHNSLKAKALEMETKLNQIQAEADARAKQETLNSRASEIEATYELNADELAIITKRLANMNDEEYTAYASELAILLKEKNREYKKTIAASNATATYSATTQAPVEKSNEIVANDITSAVDDALENATQTTA